MVYVQHIHILNNSLSNFSPYKIFNGIIYINPNIKYVPSPVNISLLQNTKEKMQNTVKAQNASIVLNPEYFLLKQWSKVIKLITKTSSKGKLYAYSIAVTPKYFKSKTIKYPYTAGYLNSFIEILYQNLKSSTTI